MSNSSSALDYDVALAQVFRAFAARGRALRAQKSELQSTAQPPDEVTADKAERPQSVDVEIATDAPQLEGLADLTPMVTGEITPH